MKTVNLDENKLTPNGAKFGRPKSLQKAKPISVPVRVPIGFERIAKSLPEIICILKDYQVRSNETPRWDRCNKLLNELFELIDTNI